MKFRTEVILPRPPFRLDPSKPVVLMGSCFTDNIGQKIKSSGWPSVVNPCGVVYNPASIALLIQLALTHRPHRRAIIESSVTDREGKFVTWLMDSKCSGDTPDECVEKAMEAIDSLENGLETADTLIVTFGTPDVWLLKDSDRLVGNCHKHPASEFEIHRLGIKEAADTWIALSEAIRQRNPRLKLIFTVSPRRYLGGGLADNSRLKAILILACEEICKTLTDTLYFPAYEIMTDDLRDYRFYADDMLHPSPKAIDYIWEKFCGYLLTPENVERLRDGEKETRRRAHRPIL